MTYWTDWEPMPELRFVVPPETTKPSKLQQRHVRLLVERNEPRVMERAYEWRDVPTVVVGELETAADRSAVRVVVDERATLT